MPDLKSGTQPVGIGTNLNLPIAPPLAAFGNAETPAVTGNNAAGKGVSGTGAIGIYGTTSGDASPHYAGEFDGNLQVNGSATVTGDVILTGGADCAEEFCASLVAEPGTVMVLGADGVLGPNQHAYDRRVVGVVSGAGGLRPAIVLDRQSSEDGHRATIALVGKVFCKADAVEFPIGVGDLLTTSGTLGHAMRADPERAFGAIIGKALAPLSEGKGLIPILVTLQ
jgi:hypothetical protein